jgi:DNA-binding beta-propeller fold protein YncE
MATLFHSLSLPIIVALLPIHASGQSAAMTSGHAAASQLRNLIGGSPRLPLRPITVELQPVSSGWTTDYISSVAVGQNGITYVLHRNLKVDPVLAVDRKGRVVRSWGGGLFTNPHSVRVDPAGNVWTVDAGNSVVLKFSPDGEQLLRFEIGELPKSRSGFRGATDIAFAPGGRIFIADGYGNARILEYDEKGRRVREWGGAGTGQGQFRLPHSIAMRDGTIYVADRENGRIQRFDLEGQYLGEWTTFGKTFSIGIAPDGNLWIGTHPRNEPNESPGWLVNVDRKTGKVLGHLDSPGLHSVDISRDGNVIADPGRGNPNKFSWFRRVR